MRCERSASSSSKQQQAEQAKFEPAEILIRSAQVVCEQIRVPSNGLNKPAHYRSRFCNRSLVLEKLSLWPAPYCSRF
jgi:hypothetical protein